MKRILVGFIFLHYLTNSNAFAEPTTTGEIHNDAKTSVGAIMAEINSASKINDKLIAPLTDETKDLKTFGPEAQKQSMNIQVSSQSSGVFLTVTGSPSAYGDFDNLKVHIDTNFDGTVDYTYTSPVVISGICNNGIITCSLGTWNNKYPYLWKCDSALRVTLLLAPNQDNLNNCKCVNRSCQYVTNSESVKTDLKAIGDAILSAIQSVKPHISITNVEIEPGSVKYFGQNNDGVGIGSTGIAPAFTNPETLFNPTNDSALNNAVATQTTAQEMNPDSLLKITQNAFVDSGAVKNSQSCQITRTINVSPGPIYSVSNSDSCGAVSSDCKLKEETVCNYSGGNCIQTIKNYNPTGDKPSTECVNMSGTVICNNGSTIYYNGGTLYSGSNTWFRISRVYECKTENPLNNASTQINTATNVIASTTKSGSTVSYTDSSTHSFSTPEVPANEDCQKSCKIKKPVANNSVKKEGTVTDLNKTTVAYEYVVRPCNTSNVCPVDPGESILVDCSCVQGFTEAATTMQSLFDASKDLVCSTN